MNDVDLSYGRLIQLTELQAINQYRTYDTYYDGEQQPQLPPTLQATLESLGVVRNLCALVVDTYCAKLNVSSVISPSNQPAIDSFMKENHWQRLTSQTHKSNAKYGDAFIRIWPNTKTGIPSARKLIPENVRPVYAQDGSERMLWVKVEWLEVDEASTVENVRSESDFRQMRRKDVYYPDHVERFSMDAGTINNPSSAVQDLGSWSPFNGDGFAELIPYSWEGIPIVHFKNKPDESDFGTSELACAIPIQADKDQAEMDLALRGIFAAAGQLWVTGFNKAQYEAEWLQQHPHEKPPALSRDPWSIWMFSDPGINLGRLSPDSLLEFIAYCDKLTNDMAVVTRTPVAFLKGEALPSGVALREMAGPLVDKVTEGQSVLGEAWESVLNLALRVGGKTAEDVSVEWEDPFAVDYLESDLKLRREGLMSKETFLRNRGMEDEDIAKELGLIDTEKEQMLEQSLTEFKGKGFGAPAQRPQ
jgi:hypothetical protein